MYRVVYEIDVDAETPMGAALVAEQYMKNGGYRPALKVRKGKTGKPELIDLEEIIPLEALM